MIVLIFIKFIIFLPADKHGKMFLLQKSHSNVEPYFVTTANKEQYKCIIPDATEQEQEYSEAYNGPNPMKLLQPIFNQDSCSYRVKICRMNSD